MKKKHRLPFNTFETVQETFQEESWVDLEHYLGDATYISVKVYERKA